MENITTDKSDWGDGPWQTEPDRVDFEHAGMPCLLSRGPSGHWCGYVAVAPSHPLHGKSYDDARTAEGEYIEVHGGLTYADKCNGHICHVAKPGEPDDVWWFGFDCAHAGDYSPKYARYGRTPGEDYRDVPYVQAETRRLADQLAAVKAGAL